MGIFGDGLNALGSAVGQQQQSLPPSFGLGNVFGSNFGDGGTGQLPEIKWRRYNRMTVKEPITFYQTLKAEITEWLKINI